MAIKNPLIGNTNTSSGSACIGGLYTEQEIIKDMENNEDAYPMENVDGVIVYSVWVETHTEVYVNVGLFVPTTNMKRNGETLYRFAMQFAAVADEEVEIDGELYCGNSNALEKAREVIKLSPYMIDRT